jgi:hypothetical protein
MTARVYRIPDLPVHGRELLRTVLHTLWHSTVNRVLFTSRYILCHVPLSLPGEGEYATYKMIRYEHYGCKRCPIFWVTGDHL